MFFGILSFFILGAAVGSFLNVVIDRTTRGVPIAGKSYWRSYCDYCRATLGILDLIPIFSFAVLWGRCRYCGRAISWQYPLVEGLTGFLFALSFYKYFDEGNLGIFGLVYILFVLSILVIVSVVDIKFSLIPTTFVYLVCLLSLFYNYFWLDSATFVTNVIWAFVFASAFFLIVAVTRGRGMGSGDIPLVFLMGLFLGWPRVFLAIFLAFIVGGLISVLLLLLRKKRFGQAIPFGPFLVLGTVIALFYGQEITKWYWSYFS
ncbi:prepilin peptidase [Candidatus Curtissbacteria bacterium]|nr:prepilin peptidase [Candidatus Curtissbacteria bacterium]